MAASARKPPGPAAHLHHLTAGLAEDEGFAAVVASLLAGNAATIGGAWGSGCALAAAALAQQSARPLLIVVPRIDAVDDVVDDLRLFSAEPAEVFAARESFPRDPLAPDEVLGQRLRLLKSLAGGTPPRLVCTSIQALLQPAPRPEEVAARSFALHTGQQLAPARLAAWLVEAGYHNTAAVELPGEFSPRAGIIDVFALDAVDPLRVEFFGDQVESLRHFEVASQRSLGNVAAAELTSLRTGGGGEQGFLTDWLPPQSWIALVEPWELEEEGRHWLERLERPQDFHSFRAVMERLVRFPSATLSAVAAGSLDATAHLRIESVERFSGEIGKVRDELDAAGAGQRVYLVCQTEAECQRLGEVFAETKLHADGRLTFVLGRLKNGFRLVAAGAAMISSGELFHRTELNRPTRRRLSKAIDSFLDLREGDLVVHVGHGIGRYRGLKLLEKGDQVEEHLELEFHGGTRLYVPSSKIGLVQKYLGGAKARPTLARLGGRTWGRQKEQVQKAVADMAVEMLEVQAARASRPGIRFPADTDWQREFDASFPYEETDDQLAAIEAIKQDMQAPRPMDRLLCGDVGYGKTEVAMRAAFKAIDAGHQVAVLVPTTILAEQHLRTFTARVAEFPFEIGVLSRFVTRRQQAEVIERLADGSLDIVIGTHRLVQPDVQFHNLGLVIIDEEQRFGVEVKERLKALRQIVDVLTMTATPIPRTLHMSLLGLRDISNLETPPADRLAVETRVTRFDAAVIRNAVLRELNRAGQMFFVHNRIHDIGNLARRLHQIVPEATVAIAHGQMPEHQLERVMLDFVDRKFDILLATTIVESGLDIPNANTIFIDEADIYGLADLHQLRGRVGRYKHRAYCYLLIDPNKNLPPVAAKRLRAIEEFSGMGAGFAIAMRDLEIRGAGNILGTEQSGHIALVGYELYCELLEQTIRKLKAMPSKATIDVDLDLPGAAYLPRGYVPDMRLKIDLYRRLARATSAAQIDDFANELADRFGAPPEVTARLLRLARLRIAAHRWRIHSIHLETRFAVMRGMAPALLQKLAAAAGRRLRLADDRTAYLVLPEELTESDAILAEIESVLQ